MLYRVYRPTTWDEVVGQEHVVRTLQGALAAARIGHAYLFSGPRGTGKTTLARIWAKAINCTAKAGQPCGKCISCTTMDEGRSLDLIEIDAASNRGIDDVRQLKETAGTAPTAAMRKVFIVDEVHMLSKDAFNGFLKLLEEPPAHAVFILATTEAHKILPTVLSRVQRFDFKKLSQAQIVSKLQVIAKAEKLKIEDEVLAAVAAASDGALRDAEVMLTKLANHAGGKIITADIARDILGLVPVQWHANLTSFVVSRDAAGAVKFIDQLAQQGADMDQFAKGYLEYLRAIMVVKIDPTILSSAGLALSDGQEQQLKNFAATMEGAHLVQAIQSFTQARTQLRTSPIASLPLELAVVELSQKSISAKS
jgi:DNA polymerase III subunit gamma/tau